jgi:DNA-damage-inducible protein D
MLYEKGISRRVFTHTYYKSKRFCCRTYQHNVIEKNLKGDTAISKEHDDNNTAVRKMLKQRGVQPEQLPADENVKKTCNEY